MQILFKECKYHFLYANNSFLGYFHIFSGPDWEKLQKPRIGKFGAS